MPYSIKSKQQKISLQQKAEMKIDEKTDKRMKEKETIALKMLHDGFPQHLIMKYTGLTKEQIQKLEET